MTAHETTPATPTGLACALASLPRATPTTRVAYLPPVVLRLTLDDLDTGIPPEYQGAELNPQLAEALNATPLSIALIGPPGTGKTRQAWAALRQSRLLRLRDRIDVPVAFEASVAPDPDAWAKREMGRDVVTVISESADILRHRYDREWLDAQAGIQHWLVVDDIGFAAPTDWAREAIYHLANIRRAYQRPTLWTTNLTADDLRTAYSPAIASRILGGDVIELDGIDRRQA